MDNKWAAYSIKEMGSPVYARKYNLCIKENTTNVVNIIKISFPKNEGSVLAMGFRNTRIESTPNASNNAKIQENWYRN